MTNILSSITSQGSIQDAVKSTSTKGFLALHFVTGSCLAIRDTLITPISPNPTWFDDLNTHLKTAKTDANDWLNNVAPKMVSTIPNQILTYDAIFDASADSILELLEKAKAGSNPALIAEAQEIIETLEEQIDTFIAEIESSSKQLQDIAKRLQKDHDDLCSNVSSIQSALTDERALIDKFNNEITTLHAKIKEENDKVAASIIILASGLLVLVAGIALCMAPGAQVAGGIIIGVGLATVAGGAAGWGYYQTQINKNQATIASDLHEIDVAKQQIIALSGLYISVSSIVDNLSSACNNLADVKAMWIGFGGQIADVKNALNQVNADVSVALKMLDVEVARKEWNSLTKFAEGLLSVQVTSDSKTFAFPTSAAA